jgi:hypothetical protein
MFADTYEGVEIALKIEYCRGLIHGSPEHGRHNFAFQSRETFARRFHQPKPPNPASAEANNGKAAGKEIACAAGVSRATVSRIEPRAARRGRAESPIRCLLENPAWRPHMTTTRGPVRGATS